MATEDPPLAPGTDPDRQTPAAIALRVFHSPRATPREREDAARRMLEAYQARVQQHLRQWPRARQEDIEDAMAEAIRRFYEKAPADHPKPEGWLMRTFLNCIKDQHRAADGPDGLGVPLDGLSGDGELPALQLAANAASSDPAEIVWRRDLLAKVAELVDRRWPTRRDMLLQYADSEPTAKIALALRIPDGALRERMSRLRHLLREALGLQRTGDPQ